MTYRWDGEDVTTNATVPSNICVTAKFLAKVHWFNAKIRQKVYERAPVHSMWMVVGRWGLGRLESGRNGFPNGGSKVRSRNMRAFLPFSRVYLSIAAGYLKSDFWTRLHARPTRYNRLKSDWTMKDGDSVKKHTYFGSVTGSARSLLVAERIALNIMQRMSGVATQTRAMVDKVPKWSPTRILDTR